jgi:hypothetical protein
MPASIKQMKYLRFSVTRLIKAEIAASWKGGQPPEDHAAIDTELKVARAQYQRALKRVEAP